jgi:urea transport system substrate-binding protein
MTPAHHISKTVRIGEVRDDGLFEVVYATDGPVDPVPWNQYVAETKGFSCDWSKTDVDNPGKFKV